MSNYGGGGYPPQGNYGYPDGQYNSGAPSYGNYPPDNQSNYQQQQPNYGGGGGAAQGYYGSNDQQYQQQPNYPGGPGPSYPFNSSMATTSTLSNISMEARRQVSTITSTQQAHQRANTASSTLRHHSTINNLTKTTPVMHTELHPASNTTSTRKEVQQTPTVVFSEPSQEAQPAPTAATR
jgi:hypothetical protein